MEIHFSRRHPIEAPVVLFPCSDNNKRSIPHPLVDLRGRLQATIVRPDKWVCTTSAKAIIRHIQIMFAQDPVYNSSSIFDRLARDQVHQILEMLGLQDIGNFGITCKRNLVVSHSDEFWIQMYYQRCRVPNTTLYVMDSPGPLRVLSGSGKWVWREAREAFIRAEEVARACPGNCKAPGLEDFVGKELPMMTQLAYPTPFFGDKLEGTFVGSFRRARNSDAVNMLRYRVRRCARLCRWLHGDIEMSRRFIAQRSSTLPTTAVLFLSSLVLTHVVEEAELALVLKTVHEELLKEMTIVRAFEKGLSSLYSRALQAPPLQPWVTTPPPPPPLSLFTPLYMAIYVLLFTPTFIYANPHLLPYI